MTPKQFKIVKELFDVVCDLPEDARRARLLEQTDDQEVIDEVLRLAGQTSIRTTRFSTPIMSAMGAMGALAGDELKAGDKLGAWTLEKEIGHGGMGAVYLARRSDGHFEQTAAVKLIYGVPSAAALEYLARERQILADLSHPNIARLIDGGATPMGQPYLVMEHIDGVPINRYITGNKLASNQVLVLFKQVFAAVSFAHAQLIVHCDLKPSNILVTSAGRPYLLDFGIAKLVDSANIVDALSSRSSAGSSAPLAYTPHYASPEQREGAPVSTKTDIYALGVMLRESIAEQPDDLVAIIAKATAARREQRYESVAALSDDIDRYLAKEPVSAREATATYCAQKFVQRRWPWVLAGSVFAATVMVFTLRLVSERDRAQESERVAVNERGRAEAAQTQAEHDRDRATNAERATAAERDRATAAETRAVQDRDRATKFAAAAVAEKNRATLAETKAVAERNRALQAEAASKQTSEFLVSIFEGSNPEAEITDIPAAKLLAQAEARLETALAGRGETQADLYAALARAQRNMGNRDRARELFSRAIAFERKQNRPLELARLLEGRARLSMHGFGAAAAEGDAREALALREKQPGGASQESAVAYGLLGEILGSMGKHAESLPFLINNVEIQQAGVTASVGLADALSLLGEGYSFAGQHENAVATMRRAVEMRRAVSGPRDKLYAADLGRFGRALSRAQKFDEAEVVFRQALTLTRELVGDGTPSVGWSIAELARTVSNAGRPRDAMPLYAEALEIIRLKLGADSPSYGVLLNNAAGAAELAGDDIEAARKYEPSLLVLEKIWKAIDLAPVRHNYAGPLMRIGRLTDARNQIDSVLEARVAALGAKHTDVVTARIASVECFIRAGEARKAAAEIDLVTATGLSLTAAQQAALTRQQARLSLLEGKVDAAIDGLARAEQLDLNRWGAADLRYHVGRIDRAELMFASGSADDRARAVSTAAEIRRALGDKLVPQAVAFARLAKFRGAN